MAATMMVAPASYVSAAESIDNAVTVNTGISVDPMSTTKYYVTADVLNVRSGPATSYPVIGTLSRGQIVNVSSISSGWAKFKFQGYTAYASAQYLAKY